MRVNFLRQSAEILDRDLRTGYPPVKSVIETVWE